MPRWPGDSRAEQTTFGTLDRATLMARVRSCGNKTTEVRMMKELREAGLSGWRRHQALPGKPDFCWRRERVVLFVDGCFWHGHGCGKNISPATNAELWRRKIEGNRGRDRRTTKRLRAGGWTVVRVWECSLAKSPGRCLQRVAAALRHASFRGERGKLRQALSVELEQKRTDLG
jgi:DNA mismatch endonuclease (patch repair protein)